MKHKLLPTLILLGFGVFSALTASAQSCAMPGKPFPLVGAHFVSTDYYAPFVGFTEFKNPDPSQPLQPPQPSNPPKVYRRKQITGTMYFGNWPGLDCLPPPPPPAQQTMYNDSAANVDSYGYPFGTLTWSASLLPVSTKSDGKITYQATCSIVSSQGDHPGIYIRVFGLPSPHYGLTDYVYVGNGDTVDLDPNSQDGYGVYAYSDDLYVRGGGIYPNGVKIFGQPPPVLPGDQYRDVWNFTREYDSADPDGYRLTVDTDTSARYHALSYSMPLADGGDPLGAPYTANYGLSEESLTQTSHMFVGTGACVPFPYDNVSSKIQGNYVETLSVEDTDDDAMRRGNVWTGDSSSVYRTSLKPSYFSGSPFYFILGKVHYSVSFGPNDNCLGNYNLYAYYTKWDMNTGEQISGQERGLVKQFTRVNTVDPVEGDIAFGDKFVTSLDVRYSIVSFEAEKLCDGEGGSSGSSVRSAHFWMNLGLAAGGVSAGQMRLDVDALDATVYSPASLLLATGSSAAAETTRDASGALRQVKAAQTFADVVALDAWSYEVRFYTLDQVGQQDSTTKLYAVSGAPFVTYKFENPDASQGLTTRLRITETRAGLQKITDFGYDDSTSTWTVGQGSGLRQESIVTTTVNGDQVKTTTVKDAANHVVSKVARTYHSFPWGDELTLEVLDPDGAALTTRYDYYDSYNNGYGSVSQANSQQLLQRTNPDGSWERYVYDDAGHVVKTIRPFLDATPDTTDETLCRVTESTYDILPDADNDSLPETFVTTVERTLGQETARRYRIDWSAPVTLGTDTCIRRSNIVCVAPGADWNDPANLVTDSLVYANGPFKGRDRRVVNPDGTATLTSYVLDASGQMTTTVKTGQPNLSRGDIVDGRRTVTFTNAAGQVTSETVTDIASNLPLTSWTATQIDTMGRPTRLDYSDGTYVTRSYACCGLVSERDRTGIVTSYTYDALGRQITSTRLGITTRTGYDADGRVTTVTRVGTDATAIVQSTSVYDLAGRLTTQFDALNRPTNHADIIDVDSGHLVRTTINPDNGTIVEVFAFDGSRLSVSGTAVAPHNFDYGVDPTDGLYVQDTAVNQDGASQPTTTEWVQTFTDFAGRPFKTLYADGATAQSSYNGAGQLAQQVDPDGVTTLFAYNARGEQEVTAVDLNGDGVIDYTGSDRITKTTNAVASKTDTAGTYTVQRATTQVWQTDSQDTPVTVSVSEQSTDGLRSWQTAFGLTTTTVTAYDGFGGRIVTTTTPDGVQTAQVYGGDLLASTTVTTSGGTQLAGATYAYDAHHRMQSTTDARNGATTFTYFTDDQIHSVTTPDPDPARTGPGYDPQSTTYAYDAAGRQSVVTQPDGGVVNTTYWPTGAVKRTWGSRTYPTEYAYDPQGRMQTLTTWQNFAGDSGRAVTTWNYDPTRGWLASKLYADNTGPSYTYTLAGRLDSRTWARTITTTYSYNAAGDPTGTSYSDATPAVAVTYDRAGRPLNIADASGSRTMSYTALGQLQNETYAGGLLDGLAVNRTFDSFSRLNGLAVPSVSSVAYGYDAASRLQTVTSGTNTATYTYAANSPLVQSVTFANGGATRLTTAKTYDHLNRLSTINSQPSTGTALSYSYTYNAANQRTRATREDNAYWRYAYDPLGQVTTGSKFLADDTAALGLAYGYSYDDIGNRKTTQVNGQTATYTPTVLNQYAQRTVPGVVDVVGAAGATATVTVSVNNGTPQATARQGEAFFKQVTVDNSSMAQFPAVKITGVKNLVGPNGEDAVTAVTKSAHLAKTPESYTYDADGNLTDDARWHYTWDGENRLIAVETSTLAAGAGVPKQKLEFIHDAQGRRIEKKVSAWNTGTSSYQLASDTHFIYDGWNLLAEFNGLSSNATLCTYLWGLDVSGSFQDAGGVGGLVFSTLGGQATNYGYAYDGNGNVCTLVDLATGVKSAAYDYNAHGETVVSEGAAAAGNPFHFSTKYTDSETGHLYYGYRYYAPEFGRWLSRDPEEEDFGPNVYVSISNDAINRIDPIGLWETRIHHDIVNSWLPQGVYETYKWKCCILDVRAAIATGSDEVDEVFSNNVPRLGWLVAQSSAKANEHGMSKPRQSKQGAANGWADFVGSNEQQALSMARIAKETGDCKMLKRALVSLGRAFHAFSDALSPAHSDYKTWYGPIDGLRTMGLSGYMKYLQGHKEAESYDVYASNNKNVEVTGAVRAEFGPFVEVILSDK